MNTTETTDTPRYGATLTEAEAKALDTAIRKQATAVDNAVAKLQALIHQAQEGQIHKALGFRSWTAYLESIVNAMPKLHAESRVKVVGLLVNLGYTQRDIAELTGASKSQIDRDSKAVKGEVEKPVKSELDKSLAELNRIKGRQYYPDEAVQLIKELRAAAAWIDKALKQSQANHPAGKGVAA